MAVTNPSASKIGFNTGDIQKLANIKDITSVKYKQLSFTVKDSFLTDEVDLSAAINYFIQCTNNINNSLQEFYTLLIDLLSPEELIWNNIHHNARSKITSFLKNQKFEYKIKISLSNEELDEYIKLFNQFAEYKKIRKAERFRLKAYNTQGILAASYIKQESEFICIHLYRITKARATGIYTFNLKHRLGNKYTGSQISRSHLALHWLDILTFKRSEVTYYDFCGWYDGSEDEELLNINKFKEQFTQHKVKEYTGVIYKNKLLAFLKKLK